MDRPEVRSIALPGNLGVRFVIVKNGYDVDHKYLVNMRTPTEPVWTDSLRYAKKFATQSVANLILEEVKMAINHD